MKAQILALVIVISSLASCTKNNDDNGGSNGSATQAASVATSGDWRVTLFTDSGNDETSNFGGYTFTFNANGTVTATKGSTVKTGTWSVSSSSNKFIIDLGVKSDSNKPLGELTDDWRVLSSSATQIRLGDDNASSGESLTFTKN